MSQSARSSFLYGIYLAVLGLVLLIQPNLLLDRVGFHADGPYWPRSTGLLACVVAFYALQAGSAGLSQMIQWSVYARMGAFVFFTVAVAIGIAVPSIFVLGLIDLVTAIWSQLALRSEALSA